MTKEFVACDETIVTLGTFAVPCGGYVVALSFYTTTGKFPGFTMCFPIESWKDFRREVADYDPEI
jgi:hypothetical protein